MPEITPPELPPQMPDPEVHESMYLNETEQKSVFLGSMDATLGAGLGVLFSRTFGLSMEEGISAAAAIIILVKMARKFFLKKGQMFHS